MTNQGYRGTTDKADLKPPPRKWIAHHYTAPFGGAGLANYYTTPVSGAGLANYISVPTEIAMKNYDADTLRGIADALDELNSSAFLFITDDQLVIDVEGEEFTITQHEGTWVWSP